MTFGQHYKTGFTGADLDELVEKAAEFLEGCNRILVPFAGSGKDIAHFAKEGRTIYSWDTQAACNAFNLVLAKPFSTNITELRGREGYARVNHPIPDMPEGVARLLNYIAVRGTDHDRAALAKTIFRSSVMGRLTQWAAAKDDYRVVWESFLKCQEYMKEWAGRPGDIHHYSGSFFQALDLDGVPKDCDGVFIDPPKVISNTDIYSGRAFSNLNSILEQRDVKDQPVWKANTYLERIKATISSTNWKTLILCHSSGISPTMTEIYSILPINPPTTIRVFDHGGRQDYLIVLQR